MPAGVTTIGNPKSDLRIYVHAGPDGLHIEQGWWILLDDSIFIESLDQAESLISYLQERIDDPQWGGDRDVKVLQPEASPYSLFVGTREANEAYPAGIMVEQRMSLVREDCILIDTRERAARLIRAIRRRAKEVDAWLV